MAAMSGQLLAEEYSYMQFTLADGTTKYIAASGLSFSFADGNMTATNGSSTLTIALTDLASMAFSNEAPTGIESAETEVTADAEIFDLKGRKVAQGSKLPQGIYIVKTKDKTFKKVVK